MTRLPHGLACAILLSSVVFGTSACDIAGSGAASDIENTLKGLPGVHSVSQEVSAVEGGLTATRMTVDVEVLTDVTADQLTTLSHTLVERVNEADSLHEAQVDLNVDRPARDPSRGAAWAHLAIDPRNANPEPPPWAEWLRLADGYDNAVIELSGGQKSSDTVRYTLSLAIFTGPPNSNIPVTVQDISAVTRRLMGDFRTSRPTDWQVAPIDLREVRFPFLRSDRGLPETRQLALWEALNTLEPTNVVFDMGENSARRDRFTIDHTPAPDQIDRVVVGQLQLIKDSGLPAEYRIDKENIVVRPGGCSTGVAEPQPGTPQQAPLQTRLRAQFETCPH